MAPAVIAALMGGSLMVPWDAMPLPDRQYATAQLIDHYGEEYQLSDSDKLEMYKTVECESGFRAVGRSSFPGEKSYGIAQINLPAHSDVTRAQAEDPDFAIDFMAAHFAAHDQRIWTCYRTLYG